jgi:small-conductance mechanosensitive channel
MNEAHFHLAVNHFPIIGAIIGAMVLAAGLALKNEGIRQAGLGILAFAALMAVPAFLSGEGAEEIVEEIAGVSHDDIHHHEEHAESFLWVISATGILALLSLVLGILKHPRAQLLAIVALVLSLVAIYMGREAGTSGGEIRHPEIRSGWQAVEMPQREAESDD